MTPALSVSGLTVRYGDTVAVDDLDLVIPAGQTVALLGPNGAGKSTAINAVLGLLHPVAGSVRVLGRRPRDAVRAGCVGAMLQHGGLPGEERVGEVLNLGGLWVPMDVFPESLRTVAYAMPSYWYAGLGRDVAAGGAPSAQGILVLAGFTAVFAALAVVVARRRPLYAVAG